jgi:hypothetical protein
MTTIVDTSPSGPNGTADTAADNKKDASGRAKPILAERFKTKMCQNYEKTGVCPYECRCMFAHGERDLRTKEMNLFDNLTTDEAIKAFQRARVIAAKAAAQKKATDQARKEKKKQLHQQGGNPLVGGPLPPSAHGGAADDDTVSETGQHSFTSRSFTTPATIPAPLASQDMSMYASPDARGGGLADSSRSFRHEPYTATPPRSAGTTPRQARGESPSAESRSLISLASPAAMKSDGSTPASSKLRKNPKFTCVSPGCRPESNPAALVHHPMPKLNDDTTTGDAPSSGGSDGRGTPEGSTPQRPRSVSPGDAKRKPLPSVASLLAQQPQPEHGGSGPKANPHNHNMYVPHEHAPSFHQQQQQHYGTLPPYAFQPGSYGYGGPHVSHHTGHRHTQHHQQQQQQQQHEQQQHHQQQLVLQAAFAQYYAMAAATCGGQGPFSPLLLHPGANPGFASTSYAPSAHPTPQQQWCHGGGGGHSSFGHPRQRRHNRDDVAYDEAVPSHHQG